MELLISGYTEGRSRIGGGAPEHDVLDDGDFAGDDDLEHGDLAEEDGLEHGELAESCLAKDCKIVDDGDDGTRPAGDILL